MFRALLDAAVQLHWVANRCERIGNLRDLPFCDLTLSRDDGLMRPVNPRCTPTHQLCGTQRRQDREPKRSKIRRALNHRQPPEGGTRDITCAVITLTARTAARIIRDECLVPSEELPRWSAAVL